MWGIADFSGGKASQRARPLTVTVVSQFLGLPVALLSLALVPGTASVADLIWSAVAGIAGFAGIVLLYRGLASGAMAMVAPVTAVTAAVIPMVVGLATDQPPGALGLAGAASAMIAIALVSLGPRTGRTVVEPRLVGLALASGTMFGIFFALLGQANEQAGMWPVVAARVGSLGFGALLLISSAPSVLGRGTARDAPSQNGSCRLPREILPWTVAAGVLDITANALFVAAAARGNLSIVAAVSSLYPASTVILALTVDRERVRPIQLAGLALAATALVLVSV